MSWKIVFARIHDALMAGAAVLLALSVRYGFDDFPARDLVQFWVGTTIGMAAVTFYMFGLGRGIWRFASITDLRVIVIASATTIVVFLVVAFLVNRLEGLPRTAPLIAWFVMIVLLGAPRLAYRALKDGGLMGLRLRDVVESGALDILIIGNANDADHVVRAYGLENSVRYRVHGIVDLARKRKGFNLRGIPIRGGLDDLDEVLAKLSRAGIAIDAAVLASPSVRGDDLALLTSTVAKWGLPLRRVSTAPLAGGEPDLESVRLEDLLGRPAVTLDMKQLHAFITDKVVAVTGAGGSIGSEIVRQVAALAPSRLVMIDSCEYALYEVDRKITGSFAKLPHRAIIADVRNRERIHSLLHEERPAIVFHAAALKHVPLVETNISEGALTNIVGTCNVADAAVAAGASAMVMVSTDKAVNPTSVMGATKRVAESYCQALDVSGVETRFITVRFGNVLGSTGSVVPLFKEQIRCGGPVTVTHPEMRRYFMTIKEATELVLQAAAAGVGRPDQRGSIFVLDMGQPVKIVDLARTLIVLAGLQPDRDIKIELTGLRMGEKLFEELFNIDEPPIPSGTDGVFIAAARLKELSTVSAGVGKIEEAALRGDGERIRQLIAEAYPEFNDGRVAPGHYVNGAGEGDAAGLDAATPPVPARPARQSVA